MTIENIKEAVSIKYIETIACYKGFKTSSIYPDHGTDLFIHEVEPRNENGRHRYVDTGRVLQLQLKATTEGGVEFRAGNIIYDLDATTFNDLIERRNNNRPLILILFILPPEYPDWLTLNTDQLVVKKCSYYYLPEPGDLPTENVATKRIEIDRRNIISIDSFTDLMQRFG